MRMSRILESRIEVDKISYIHYSRESIEFPSKIKRAWIDFYLDDKKYRLVLSVKDHL